MRAAGRSLIQHWAGALATLVPGTLSRPLRAARSELQRSLDLAFCLAATHRQAVLLEPGQVRGKGRLGLQLPEGVAWGRPSTVPLPPRLANTGWRNGKPRPITVTPHRRAAANVWFLHHGRETLCLCVGLSGATELLHYRPLLGAWTPC